MNNANCVAMIVIISVLVFITGCATSRSVSVVDKLPSNTPKGYVEYYASNDETYSVFVSMVPFKLNIPTPDNISSIDVDELAKTGSAIWLSDRKNIIIQEKRARIAFEPGKYCFDLFIIPGGALDNKTLNKMEENRVRLCDVSVETGKITFVRVTLERRAFDPLPIIKNTQIESPLDLPQYELRKAEQEAEL